MFHVPTLLEVSSSDSFEDFCRKVISAIGEVQTFAASVGDECLGPEGWKFRNLSIL
jgi:hypothetical protein